MRPMIHPEPIFLDDTLRCFVELVPEPTPTSLKPLVADPRRPLESLLLHFYRSRKLVGTYPWTSFFAAPEGVASSAQTPTLSDGTTLAIAQLEAISTDAWLICQRYGYESYVRYAPIAA
jgi:hypothetical protein